MMSGGFVMGSQAEYQLMGIHDTPFYCFSLYQWQSKGEYYTWNIIPYKMVTRVSFPLLSLKSIEQIKTITFVKTLFIVVAHNPMMSGGFIMGSQAEYELIEIRDTPFECSSFYQWQTERKFDTCN